VTGLTRTAAASSISDVVDVYNGANGKWSMARLSDARFSLAAASTANMTLFAGGQGALLRLLLFCSVVSECFCCICLAIPVVHSRASLKVMFHLMLWTCTTAEQGLGRPLDSALRALIFQLHLFGTRFCLLGVLLMVRFCE
jgi:hypothetical protein